MPRPTPTASTPQPARNWSARLGKLAAELPVLPAPTAVPPDNPPPNRLAAVLAHFGRREVRNEMNRSLRAQEFVAP